MSAESSDARASFAREYNVPRGTMEYFDAYANLLLEWQTRFNLVAPSTLAVIWQRHFADSAQITTLADPNTRMWLDFGSGAGFPALVVALLSPGHFHLFEATAKKCRFLAAVVDALNLTDRVTIHNARIEAMAPFSAEAITARACAPLEQLFLWGERHGRTARWLLLKGRSAEQEIRAARKTFDFDCELVPSRTSQEARIVIARNVRRR